MFMCTSLTLALYSNQKMLSDANIDEAIRLLQEEQRVSEETDGAEDEPVGSETPPAEAGAGAGGAEDGSE